MSNLQQQYLDAIKANAEVATMNATLQTDLIDARDEIAALRAEIQHRAQIDAEDTHRLQSYLDDVMRAGDLEHARMAALVEACEAVADFIQSYAPDSLAAYAWGYAQLRNYGKNARAAVAAVRPQADALLAELTILRRALDQIDQHRVGACDSPISDMPEPCEECGEMREIASQALATIGKVRDG